MKDLKQEFLCCKGEFYTYAQNFDKEIKKQTQFYDSIFDFKDNGFYRAIFYAIKEFLSNEDNNKLFIKLPVPVSHFGKDAKTNLAQLQVIISEILTLATINKQKEFIEAPIWENLQEGEKYYSPNLNPTIQKIKGPLFIEVAKNSGNTLLRIRNKKKYFKSDEAKIWYEKNFKEIVRMKSFPTCNPEGMVSAQTKTLKDIDALRNRISELISLPSFPIQYNSALIVGHKLYATMRIDRQEYFDTALMFETKLPDDLLDIVCFIGDQKYLSQLSHIQRKIIQGVVKKAIFIGNDFPDFTENEENIIFDFSFAEMYRYFWSSDEFLQMGSFKPLDFSWITEKIHELENLLQPMNLQTDKQRRLIGYLMCRFTGFVEDSKIGHCKVDENELVDYLYDNFDLDDSQTDIIVEWNNNLTPPPTTPKKQRFEKLSTNHRSTHLIHPYSYKRKLIKFLKINRTSDILVVDILGNNQLPVVVDTLKLLPTGTLSLMSYVTPMKICDFMLDDFWSTKAIFRNGLYDKFQLSDAIGNNPAQSMELLDYFSDSLLDEYINNAQLAENIQTKYQVFTENDSIILDGGNVIVDNQKIQLADVDFETDEYLPTDITYYSRPIDFDSVIRIIHDFPSGKDVAYYVHLWKEKLKSLCDTKYSGSAKEMQAKILPFLKLYQLRSYMSLDSDVNFPHRATWNRLINVLLQESMITNEEKKYLISASRADKERSMHGKLLKDALLDYQITGKLNEYLIVFNQKAIKQREALNAEILKQQCLKTIIVNNIKKVK